MEEAAGGSRDLVIYEFPSNERIRACLRIEHCFAVMRNLLARSVPESIDPTLRTLFELFSLTQRPDLRKDLIQDLQRLRIVLGSPRCPGVVPPETRGQWTERLQAALQSLVSPPPGARTPSSLLESDWLSLVRTRLSVPGGCCAFDMPSLHYWIKRSDEERAEDLRRWAETTKPIEQAVSAYLELLRSTEQTQPCRAARGTYSQNVDSRKNWALLRVGLSPRLAVVPDVNINKFLVWIHFSDVTESLRTPPSRADVEFTLGLCGL